MNQSITLETSLSVLKSLWSFSDETLESVLKVFQNSLDESNEYLNFMDGAEITDPKEGWVEWCHDNDIAHEADCNPFEN